MLPVWPYDAPEVRHCAGDYWNDSGNHARPKRQCLHRLNALLAGLGQRRHSSAVVCLPSALAGGGKVGPRATAIERHGC